MTGCVICMNPVDRKFDRWVRIGYLCEMNGEVGPLLVRAEYRHGANYKIRACVQCRYDLMGGIRRWLSSEFVDRSQRGGPRGELDMCPVCHYRKTQDCRTLCVAGIPGLGILHEDFHLEDGVVMLTTCQDCRSEFTKIVLCSWLAGEFVADSRAIRHETRYQVKLWQDPNTGRRCYPARLGWPPKGFPKVSS